MTSGFSSEGVGKNGHLLVSLWKEMLPNSLHENSVTLIPKTDKNTRKEKYRPITLVNIDIQKILRNICKLNSTVE